MKPSVTNKCQATRVEPPCWWIGMRNTKLMLMVRGTNICKLIPVINHKGVEIQKTQKTNNPNYLFIFLSISPETQAGQLHISLLDGLTEKMHIDYPLKSRTEGSSQRSGFGPEDVMYLLMPDRFANGNPAIDSTSDTKEKVNRSKPNGRHGGDIQGIIDHLDYLADLGISALWTTPLLEDDMAHFSYHQYAISDYYKIDSRFGCNSDYVRLSEECRQRGIKLIMDVVLNHCGLNHWWMKDLPDKSWIHQFAVFTRSNYRMSTVNDPYASDQDKMLYTNGWFDTSMPDINLKHPLVLTYFKQVAIFWLEYANLNGLRVDTFPFNDIHAASEWTKAILDEYPKLNIVGECWQHHPSEIAFWQGGSKNYNHYNSHLKSVMDFPLTDAFTTALNDDTQAWDMGVAKFYNNYVLDYLYKDANNLLIFVDNHDIQRFASSIKGSLKKYKMAMTHLLTTRGIPQIYAGTEIMMNGKKEKGDGFIRKDFPGGWACDARDAFTRAGRTKKESQAFDYLQKLIHYRNNKPALQTGAFRHFVPEANTYVYFRYNQTEMVMVVLNNQTRKQTISLDRFAEMLKGKHMARDVITETCFQLRSSITIPGKTALLLEIE